MRFQQGNKFGKGRPEGSSNKLIAINAVFQVMEENKDDFLEALRAEYKKNPILFYKTICQPLLPKTNFNINENSHELSFSEILDNLEKA